MSQRRIPYRVKAPARPQRVSEPDSPSSAAQDRAVSAWLRPLVSARPRHRVLILGGCLLAIVLVGLRLERAELEAATVMPVAQPLPYEKVASLPAREAVDMEQAQVPKPFTVKRGQAPSMLLQELGVEPESVHAATAALGDYVDLRKLRAGESGFAYYDETGSLSQVRLRLAQKGWVGLERTQLIDAQSAAAQSLDTPTWTATWREFVRTNEVRQIEGTLDSFLVSDVAEAGAPMELAYAMSNVLQWDLDFNRDLRQGDTFRVLYEEEKLDGSFNRIGRVLALTYVNQGVEHEAFLWEDDANGNTEIGYYDRDGRPLQKMFLRSPLPFTRVTSRFTHRRFHPVLKTYRPHYGVDFGAPKGTPARVTASGTVTFAGRNGGAGNMVRVRHANGYETSYLHLSGYGPGVRTGKRLRQGDIVGYVGNTGLSTGPHLDYRVKRNGKYMDPMRLENRPAEPIPQSRLAAYQQRRDLLVSALAGELDPAALAEPLPGVQVASVSDGEPASGESGSTAR